jgi:hypothetical protein
MMAEREGFEPSVPLGTHDFQSCPFGQLGHLSKITAYAIILFAYSF